MESIVKKRLTLIMTFVVLGGFSILIIMNLAALLGLVPSKYISPNDVQGMAVEHNNLLYTLNFEQQNALVDIFNRAIPVTQESIDARNAKLNTPPEIQKIIIYRFSGPAIEIKPIAYIAKSTSALDRSQSDFRANLVFSAPAWNPHGLLEEAASDEMHHILHNTYDP